MDEQDRQRNQLKRLVKIQQADSTTLVGASHIRAIRGRTKHKMGGVSKITYHKKVKDGMGNQIVTGMIDDLEEGFGREYRDQVEKNVLKSMIDNKKGTHSWLEHEQNDREKVKEMFVKEQNFIKR